VFGPSVSTLSRYFDHRRTLALGVAFTGVGISSFAFSPLFQLLLDKYGLQGALLILAGIELNLCLCGTLLRPITLKEDLMQSKLKDKATGILQKLVQFFDLSLLTDRGFMLYVLSISFTNFGYFIPVIHLVPHAKLLGHDSYSAAFLLSAASITDIFSRLLCGWLADRYKAQMLYIYVMWAMATGITITLIPVGTTYVSLLIISVFYGLFAGALGPLIFGLIPHIMGIDKVSNEIGLYLMLESFAGLLGPPLSGELHVYHKQLWVMPIIQSTNFDSCIWYYRAAYKLFESKKCPLWLLAFMLLASGVFLPFYEGQSISNLIMAI